MNTVEVRPVLAERVRRGAALLDEKEPGWRDRIAPAELDLGSCNQCIIGQVFGLNYAYEAGMYNAAVDQLRSGNWEKVDDYELGFDAYHPQYGHDELRDAWIGFIKGEWS